jgi:3-deoxy-D-manno-octulosonate 8-phosphate phosphatase (KDO 8-P phosphatase)
MKIAQRCQSIELILSDVDGVLTDGRVIIDNQGIETKHFHIRDGLGIRLWQRSGGRFGLITGRSSHVVRMRAVELDIALVRQGVADKLAVAQALVDECNLKPEQVAYIGDDLPDLPVVRFAGLGIAVADACHELKQAAHHVTTAPGGMGAVREAIELILKAQRRWDDLVQSYEKEGLRS